jgi:hypothetical protein
MSCILRISGESLDVDALLRQHNLPPDRSWKKGEARLFKGKAHIDSGVNFIASDADLNEFERQLIDATAFLELNVTSIVKMATTQGVQFAILDFGIALNEGYVAQFCFFPPQLIKLLASAGVGLEISHYACSKSESES